MATWRCALELNEQREQVAGSAEELAQAIARGADLRIYTEFLHNEHIDVDSPNSERVQEVAEFGVTYWIEGEAVDAPTNDAASTWVAGIMSLRQPIDLPSGFGRRPSMSFFLYNQDGTQAIARPHLDGVPLEPTFGPAPITPPRNMVKYRQLDAWDAGTNAPSQNFVYDFDRFRYFVDESWREVLRHDERGVVLNGRLDDLVDAFSAGCAIKIGIGNLCANLATGGMPVREHELFVQGGSAYYYTDQKLFLVGTHPVIRVEPNVPLRYGSHRWDFGWVLARTDGRVVYRRCDPYSLHFSDQILSRSVRWFVR